ncbi:MAG TPA: helix-hairpin-helix domain-containing protein [Terracidiphilus sp.]
MPPQVLVAVSSLRAENGVVRGSVISTGLALALAGGLLLPFRAIEMRATTTVASAHATPPAENRVDINHATVEELMTVPGMTRSWAGRIVRFRPYRSKTDLVQRGVLPGEVYDRIKDYVIAHRAKK